MIQLDTGPDRVRNLRVVDAFTDSFHVSHVHIEWDWPNGQHSLNNYRIMASYTTQDPSDAKNEVEVESIGPLMITQLKPSERYIFIVKNISRESGFASEAVEVHCTTHPLKLTRLDAVVGKNYVVLHWDVQSQPQSKCRFRLSYINTANIGKQNSSAVETINRKKFRFGSLASDTYYTFTVIVIMGTAQQEAQSKPETITVGIGGAHRSLPVLQRRDSRQLIVTFENDQNAFADVNGVVDNYAVIVSQDIQLEDDDDYDLRSWFDVHAQRRWPPYRASSLDYNPFRGNSVKSAKFIIGEEDCEQQRPNEKYCNGPLRANVNFFVKIRAYTMSNIAMETSWVSISDVDDIDEEYPNFLVVWKSKVLFHYISVRKQPGCMCTQCIEF
uniref:protein-tyrosine-phosphatase n=1 Tax=Parascaris univalens TaxID=6257 RepID=A0A915BH62_PARUN